ncbi:hypothetical protein JL720_5412 [Aureococcus anophagefferens]|nr:hypothetical protein JL720_5412 [Aureococcus anophagefferens]
MKIYCIKGTEGTPGYLKQSMKLPKSWGSKPLLEVLKLFVDTHNKKFPDGAIDAGGWHLERPLGSTLFPDDHVDSALCVALDRGGMDVKSQYKVGDVVAVTIEPHATLKDITNEKVVLELKIKMPDTRKVAEVSDDEGCTGAEALDPPRPSPSTARSARSGKSRRRSRTPRRSSRPRATTLARGDKLTEAPPAACPLCCKRAEVLLKGGRPAACVADATVALGINPDSAKAYKLRAKARCKLGDYGRGRRGLRPGPE